MFSHLLIWHVFAMACCLSGKKSLKRRFSKHENEQVWMTFSIRTWDLPFHTSEIQFSIVDIGVGASTFWECEGFWPNFPKLAQKGVARLLPTNILPQKSWRPFLVRRPKKGFHLFFLKFGHQFWSQTKLGAIFARIFRDFAQIFRDFFQSFRDFFLDFQQINTFGDALPPPAAPPAASLTEYTIFHFIPFHGICHVLR